MIDLRFEVHIHVAFQKMFNSVQLLSCVQFFVTPWTASCQTSLSITNSHNLLNLISIELVMPSNYLILCGPHLFLLSIFPSITDFSISHFFKSGDQSIGVSASASVLLKQSIPGQVDKRIHGPQGGERDLEFSRRRKGQTSFFFSPLHSLVLVT